MTLETFLAGKPLFYAEFDPHRIKRVWASIKSHFTLPTIIHIVGTNGKGTTGRFLAEYLVGQGRRAGHYTSPHITRFNERIWLNGAECDDATLEAEHQRLSGLLDPEDAASLSYFEYTTLLAAAVFEKRCDFAVMEAGLGGEYDATSIFEPLLLLVTPIGLDHEAFLGETIEAVATTKLNVMKSDAIIGYQSDREVYEIAREQAKRIGREAVLLCEHFPRPDGSDYLEQNRLLALLAARYLGFAAKREDFGENRLFGRFSRIAPNIIVDVGHNAMAAEAIARRLGERKVKLVYNTLEDKDYETILRLLKYSIINVEIIDIEDKRALPKAKLVETLERVGIAWQDFKATEDNEDYLVFGSFKTVEAFCKRINEK